MYRRCCYSSEIPHVPDDGNHLGDTEAPVKTSTPAVAQVVPVKNSYYRKTTSNEKVTGRWGSPVSSDRSIYEKDNSDKKTSAEDGCAGPVET